MRVVDGGNNDNSSKDDSNSRSMRRSLRDSALETNEQFDRLLGWNRYKRSAISSEWFHDPPHLGHESANEYNSSPRSR